MSRSRISTILGLLLTAVLLSGCEDSEQTGASRVITDPAMAAAIREGQATFPDFMRAFTSPEPGWSQFQVRHRYTTETGFIDNIWLDLQAVGEQGRLICVVPEDQDERVVEFEPGEEIIAEPTSVNDWLFIDEDGIFVGGYTLRVTMDRIGNTSGDDPEEDVHGGIRFRDLDEE